jgi:serine/threonine-protein kinase
MIGRLVSGRYRLIAPLGEGGMATIWRALDEQLDREVAVKLLRPQFGTDAGFTARFRQEARSAGSLSHPNIVSVYDYGTDAEAGDQYIVMQLVDGQDLASILRDRGSLSPDDVVRIGIAVASALEAAHRKGIVHRDVKPGNILITDEGDVKVTDFGIARAVSEASMTVTGTTLGSVHYFSPEQARGDEVTGASDVYALGIVLFEMLTGRRPFEADSAAAVALKRLNEDPPPPSSLGRPVPPGLEAIVMRALRREPAERFPDAGAMAEALRAWRRHPDAPGARAALAGAIGPGAVAAAAAIPASGEPTVYVPPRVARPADRAPGGPPPRRVEPYPYEEREGQPWWIWLLALLAIALLGAIGFLGAQLLGGLPTASPSPSVEQVEVPDWEGDPISAVRLEADDLGLEIEIAERQPSEEVDEDRVISHDPPAGELVPEGTTVRVVLSTGQEEVEVPTLAGQTRDEATRRLEAAGLNLGAVAHEPSAQAPETVIRSDPPAGTTVPAGSEVSLILSSGPTPSPTPSPTPVPTPSPTPVPTPTPPPLTPTPTPTPP